MKHKTLALFIGWMFTWSSLAAQSYKIIDAKSSVKFGIKNFGLTVDGSFKGLQGEIVFDENNINGSTINALVDVATVNTGIDARDRHLKKAEYFDVMQFPFIRVVSSEISKTGVPGEYLLNGDITIKGTTKHIAFKFIAHGSEAGYVFTTQFTLNRRDFNIGGGSFILSDNVNVSLNVFAAKQ